LEGEAFFGEIGKLPKFRLDLEDEDFGVWEVLMD
jgi:hypothetical protein